MPENHCWYLFRKERKKKRAETLQHCLAFDNFKPWLKISIFNCIFWLTGAVFLEVIWGFPEDGAKTI
jgi:hypothetical protein